VKSPSKVWGKAQAKIEFGSVIALKYEIWWQQF